MTVSEVRRKYLEFFKSKEHVIVPSSSLVPENDPTTLFTGSGMQPMVPYLLGETHPQGKRIVDSQKCFRSGDIEEVGDNRHTTFFEMLGNWSLGDYFKKDQLAWVFEFLVDEIKLNPKQLFFTVFAGDEKNSIPRDAESVEILKKEFKEKGIDAKAVDILTEENGGKVGMRVGLKPDGSPELGRIFYYNAKKNWWSRAGVPENMPVGEPGGPDSEIFFDFYPEAGERHIPGFGLNQTEGLVGRTFQGNVLGEFCHPNCDCGRFVEIGNSVFMEYRKGGPVEVRPPQNGGGLTSTDVFERLQQRNVDFGGGLERIAAASNQNSDVFEIDVFKTIITNLEAYTEKKYNDQANKKSYRIIADHIRAAVFLMADGVMPSNTEKGYFVRRLLRRAILHLDKLQMDGNQLHNPLDTIVQMYKSVYPNLLARKREIEDALNLEEQQFRKTLQMGKREFGQFAQAGFVTGSNASTLFTTYGFPMELTTELAREQNIELRNMEGFGEDFERHRELSRAGAEKKFKGGLADTSEMSLKYHTATHLLHQALRDVLGDEVRQKGSNITPERLRFDFAFGRKMTDEEKKRVEDIVNEKIQAKLPMQKVILPFAEAEKTGALHFFGEKYGDEVSVYFIGDSLDTAYSKEFCGGPHITNTGILGTFKIAKEEAVSAGVRRIKAVLND